VRALRNIAIIALLALAVAAVPGGGDAAEGVLAALTLAFLSVLAFAGYRLFRENHFAYLSLTDGQRAAVAAAAGAIVLMIAGTDELLDSGGGLFLWLAVLGIAVFTLVRAWGQSRSY
jgi:hypothetical protein